MKYKQKENLLLTISLILSITALILSLIAYFSSDVFGMAPAPTATVILRWQPCFDLDLSGYRVYSVKANTYTWLATFSEPSAFLYPINIPYLQAPEAYLFNWIQGSSTYESDPRQLVTIIKEDTCFVVRSVDQFNHESANSNVVCATLYPKPEDVYNEPQTPDNPDCYCPTNDEEAAVLLRETYGQGEVVP